MLLPGGQANVTLGNLDYSDTIWDYRILRSTKISSDVPRRHKGRKRPLSKRTRTREDDGLLLEHVILIATEWAQSSTPSYSVCASTRSWMTGIHTKFEYMGEE